MALFFLCFLGLCSFWSPVAAQQLLGTSFPLSYPELDAKCLNALNQTANCPALLAYAAIDGPLSNDQVNLLCDTKCYDSLKTVQADIKAKCTSSNDVIVDSRIAYPATYIIDNFMLAWNVSCRKDRATDKYCDTLFASRANQSTSTMAKPCSDCQLGIQQMELDSPLGYSEGFAQSFRNATSSCHAAGYAFTSPPAYARNHTATVTSQGSAKTSLSQAACTHPYTIKAGDTCSSIARAQSVSTFSLLHDNHLNIYCESFPAPGKTICLPPSCAVYTVQANDTCIGISRVKGNITATQLRAWNPNINLLCSNLDKMKGNEICITPPGGWLNAASPVNQTVSTAITAAPVPPNAEAGTNRHCGKWYTVQQGDSCALLSTRQSVALADFYFLNPEINSTCGNLIIGRAYCIGAVGSYTNGGATVDACKAAQAPSTCFGPASVYPTAPLMLGNATYVPTGTAAPSAKFTHTRTSLLPTASGTIPYCYKYRNYVKTNKSSMNSTMPINGCLYISLAYETNISALVAWNPSLDEHDCNFQPGHSYCVLKDALSVSVSTTSDASLSKTISSTLSKESVTKMLQHDNGA